MIISTAGTTDTRATNQDCARYSFQASRVVKIPMKTSRDIPMKWPTDVTGRMIGLSSGPAEAGSDVIISVRRRL